MHTKSTLPTSTCLLNGRSVLANPKAVTDFARDDFDLELFALFAVCVSNKNADQQSAKLAQFLLMEPTAESPLDAVQLMMKKGTLRENLVAAKLGQYDKRLVPAFKTLTEINLRTVAWEDLMYTAGSKNGKRAAKGVQGIGQKTAKFFVLHSRAQQRICALDAMILLYAAEQGYPDCPLVTPGDETLYKKIEAFVLDCFDRQAEAEGLTKAERYAVLDLRTWEYYRELSVNERKAKRATVKGK